MTQIVLKLDFKDLEKLLVTDGKVNLEIGNAIAQEFSKRYLKSFAQGFSENWIRGITNESANKALRDYLDDNKIYANLKCERTENLVKGKILSALREELEKEANKFLEENELKNWVHEYVKGYVQRITYEVLKGMKDESLNAIWDDLRKIYSVVQKNNKEEEK